MSWSGSGTMKKVAGGPTEVDIVASPQMGNGEAESKRAIEVAKSVAQSVVESDVFAAEGSFSVTISGHSNTNHEDQVGWANDYFSISISQLSKPAERPAESS